MDKIMLMNLVQILSGTIFKLKSLGKLEQMIFSDVTFVNVRFFILFKYEKRYMFI